MPNTNNKSHRSEVPLPARRPERGLARRSIEVIRRVWNQQPVPKPTVDPELASLPLHERCVEVLKYELAELEYALSSGGGLRAWFKLNVLVFLLLAIPAVFIVPVVTAILAGVASWSEYLMLTVRNLAITAGYLLLTVFVLATLLFVVRKIIAELRARAMRREREHTDFYDV